MEKPRILVPAGVGTSAEPDIRTLHAADGLWEEHRVEDIAALGGFDRDPGLVQAFYNARRRQLQQPEIQPNATHLALAKLQDAFDDRFLLVMQNIGNLHGRVSNTNVIHMHGELLKARCLQSGQVLDWTGGVTPENKYHCYQFPVSLRSYAVQLSEMPLGMDEIYMALSMTDIFIAIGTSRHVYPTAGFVHEAKLYGAHTVEPNLESSQVGNELVEKYYSPVGQAVPRFIEKLLKEL